MLRRSDYLCGGEGKVEDTVPLERPAVVDGDHDAATRFRIGNPQFRPKRQRAMGGGIARRIEPPATGREALPFRVERREPAEAARAVMVTVVCGLMVGGASGIMRDAERNFSHI